MSTYFKEHYNDDISIFEDYRQSSVLIQISNKEKKTFTIKIGKSQVCHVWDAKAMFLYFSVFINYKITKAFLIKAICLHKNYKFHIKRFVPTLFYQEIFLMGVVQTWIICVLKRKALTTKRTLLSKVRPIGHAKQVSWHRLVLTSRIQYQASKDKKQTIL